MTIIDNTDYHKIIKYRRDAERLLDMLLDKKSNQYNVMLHSIVSLFIIDYDNLEKKFFDKKNMNYITDLINDYINNDNKSVELNNKQLNSLIRLSKKGKINYNTNKSLVLKLASLYNEECNNKLMKINIDSIKKLCDSFK